MTPPVLLLRGRNVAENAAEKNLQLGAVIILVYNDVMTVSISIRGWRPVMAVFFVPSPPAMPGGGLSC
jgi:hypothetical protein